MRDDIIQMALDREIRITTIDPGTNCAFRHCALKVSSVSPEGVASFETRMLGQTFFHGPTTGKDYVERMQMLSKHMIGDPACMKSDIYAIEGQFKSNVTITLGVLIGIISTLRSQEVSVRTKRTGACVPANMPYMIAELPTTLKSCGIRHVLSTLDKIPKEKLKRAACVAATKICTDLGDADTLKLMTDVTKSDDIADTVCYEYALFAYLHNPSLIGGRRH